MANQVFLWWHSSNMCVYVCARAARRFTTVLIYWWPYCDWSFPIGSHKGFISHAETRSYWLIRSAPKSDLVRSVLDIPSAFWQKSHCPMIAIQIGTNDLKFIKTPSLWRRRWTVLLCSLSFHLPLESSRTRSVHNGNQMAR